MLEEKTKKAMGRVGWQTPVILVLGAETGGFQGLAGQPDDDL